MRFGFGNQVQRSIEKDILGKKKHEHYRERIAHRLSVAKVNGTDIGDALVRGDEVSICFPLTAFHLSSKVHLSVLYSSFFRSNHRKSTSFSWSVLVMTIISQMTC